MFFDKHRFKVLGAGLAIGVAVSLGIFFWNSFYSLDLFLRGESVVLACVSLEEPKRFVESNNNCEQPVVFGEAATAFVSPNNITKGANLIWFSYVINSQYVKSSCVVEMRHRICSAEVYLTPKGVRCGTCELQF